MSHRKTLSQLAAEANGAQPMQISGKPADVCPYCGCGMFVNGTREGDVAKFQYVWCRNKNCGKRFQAKQPPAVLVREIGVDDVPSISGQQTLTLHRNAG